MPSQARRQRFVNAYVGEAAGNAAEAARLAGYSAHTARTQGSKLLTFPDVKAAIEERQKALAEQSGFSAEQVIKELASLAQAVPDKVFASDKIKALELLGKAHGMFKDQKDTGSRITVNIGFLTANTPSANTPRVMATLPHVEVLAQE
jgi:chaperonin GroEL (HSP60 family)